MGARVKLGQGAPREIGTWGPAQDRACHTAGGGAKCGTGLRQSADLSAESALAAEFPGGRRDAENARKAMGTRKTKKIIHVLANAIRRCSSVKIQ